MNAQNIECIRSIGKNLIGAVKPNLEIVLSKQDCASGKFVKISQIKLTIGVPIIVYIHSIKEPVMICKDIFSNKDASQGELFLLSTDVTNTYQLIISTYQERWGIEDYHKSLKNNASLHKSPTRTIQTQQTHRIGGPIFCQFVCLY